MQRKQGCLTQEALLDAQQLHAPPVQAGKLTVFLTLLDPEFERDSVAYLAALQSLHLETRFQ